MMLLEAKANFRVRSMEVAHKICDRIGDSDRRHAGFIENLIYEKMIEAATDHIDPSGDRII